MQLKLSQYFSASLVTALAKDSSKGALPRNGVHQGQGA